MIKTTNNPDLVSLLGMKFHIRDISQHDDVPNPVRELLKARAINADMFVYSIIFNVDSPPEIGLVQSMDDPDHMEYYRPSALVFSPPSGSSQPLLGGIFHDDGSLIALIHHKQSEAA